MQFLNNSGSRKKGMSNEHKHEWEMSGVYYFCDPDENEHVCVLYACTVKECESFAYAIGDLWN